MARIRTIKPEYWQDEKIGELSLKARLVFIASWNLADDEGLLKWNPMYIRAQVFPYDNVTKEEAESILGELSEHSLIVPYKDCKGQIYGWIVNFRKHQRIDKPQKPKHPLPSIQNPEVRQIYADRDDWRCGICGEEIDRTTDDRSKVLSLDHKKPIKNGGLHYPSNIQATHFGCNSSKKDRDYSSKIVEHSENVPGKVVECSSTERKGKEQGIRNRDKRNTSIPNITSTHHKNGDNVESTSSTSVDGFLAFWSAYPKKVEKKKSQEIWKRRKLEKLTEKIVADVANRSINDQNWIDGYIPNPTTYLNGDRWDDEIKPRVSENGTGKDVHRETATERAAWQAEHDRRVIAGRMG